MRKLILQNEELNIDAGRNQSQTTGFVTDRELLKSRSKRYLELIGKMDADTLTDTKGVEEFMEELQKEFNIIGLGNLPLGIISKCFLGHPYEVHMLDLSLKQIVKHYEIGEALPEFFERYRSLAKHNAYAVVEVYRDYAIMVYEDGSTSKL